MQHASAPEAGGEEAMLRRIILSNGSATALGFALHHKLRIAPKPPARGGAICEVLTARRRLSRWAPSKSI